jgi:hypothetical protein
MVVGAVMAGLVQAVLADKEIDLLIEWYEQLDRKGTKDITLAQKLRGWQQSCACKT